MLTHITCLYFDTDGTRGWSQCGWNEKRNNAQGNFQPEQIELMQYTGLKDKSQVEIYEGDIVKHENGIRPVTWDARLGAWDMRLSANVNDQEALAYKDYEVEIIGNIYENPELIYEEQKTEPLDNPE